MRKVHNEIGELMIQLLDINILKDENRWAEKILIIRQKFNSEEKNSSAKKNMRAWAVHWDRQLYKVIQIQFWWALESIDEQMNIHTVELIMRLLKKNN